MQLEVLISRSSKKKTIKVCQQPWSASSSQLLLHYLGRSSTQTFTGQGLLFIWILELLGEVDASQSEEQLLHIEGFTA